ncbi:hypothetical protein LCGC14_1680790 [marine sediment metagenome]|uniref:Uncharacterized protein n=1 Tax=marine sediment metagenome TaxID=412755 RepID=A0A0F9HNQ7_9ZZZZ
MTAAIQTARAVPPIDYAGVPDQFHGKLAAVCRTSEECGDLVRWFGSADFCPQLPIMVIVPGADSPTLIPGMGYATAAELQDCAIVTWYDQTEKIGKTGHVLDFDALRERRGLMRREEVDAAVREAMLDRIARHKANPVSDPPRQPQFPNPTNKTKFARGKKVTDA